MKRIYESAVKKYLNRKICLITGPRQCGKTTLAKGLPGKFDYLTFDDDDDRLRLKQKSWDRKADYVVFDEIHKMKRWKQWLKGVFDKEENRPPIVVTGSARMDSYRKVGDSLAGRYFQYRLHPFDVWEVCEVTPKADAQDVLDQILQVGGFPEPYLEGSPEFYTRWKSTHLDIILRQDLIDLESVTQIKQIQILIDLLRDRVGSAISYSGLAEDLQVSDKTVKRWLEILESLYIVFKVTPYSKNIARSVLKMPKYYFYDVAQVRGEGPRLENAVAASLLKQAEFKQDCEGVPCSLHYLAQKGGREIDFFLELQNGKETRQLLIEVKASDDEPSRHFQAFRQFFTKAELIQVVKELKREKTFPNGVEVRNLARFLAKGI